MDIEDFMFWIMGFSVIFLLGLLFIVLPIYLFHEASIDSAYEKGEITLSQFCDEMTHNGEDSRDIPVICYQYYDVKRTGTYCHMVGKIEQCDPMLAPAN